MRASSRTRSLVLALTTLALALSALLGAGVASAAPTPAVRAHRIIVHPQMRHAPKPLNGPDGVYFDCSGQGIVCYGVDQIRRAYNLYNLYRNGVGGQGATIVIIDAYDAPNLASDLAAFDATFNLNAPSLSIYRPYGLSGSDEDWAAEITLDVEWSHAIAPKAKITLVEAASSQDADILAATKWAVDNNLGDVISQSFGEAETCVDPHLLKQQHDVFQEATNKGISLFASSGDDGVVQYTCDGNDLTTYAAVSSPAVDPLVIAVGGTQLSANYKTGSYNGEVVWNDGYGASGGGYSVLYSRPNYQINVVPSGGHHRWIPDVAYNAGVTTGVIVVFEGYYDVFGGTSAGSPQWAALTALLDQVKGHRMGDLHDKLYALAATSQYHTDFHDITGGNNSFNAVSGYNAHGGWDASTGLGTPNAASLICSLSNFCV